MALDLDSGTAAATIARVNGPVYAAAPDGAGGWYIGGDFTQVGGRSRHNAALVKGDGTLGGWNPNLNYPVHSIVVVNLNRRIYLGGEFTTVRTDTKLPDGSYAKATVGGMAATKKSDGSFDAAVPLPAIGANPDPKATRFSVNAMALSADRSQLFVGGTFTAIAGTARPGLALVDLGDTPSVNAAWNPQPDGPVAAFVQSADGRLVVGGSFTSIGGSLNGLAVVHGSGAGAVDTNWGITANGPVAVLTAAHGGIYVGGSFTEMGGLSRNRLALIKADVPGGSIESFNPGVDGDVLAITAAPSGAGIYVGGTFSAVGGLPRRYLAALNTEFGTAVAGFDARVAAPVRALATSTAQVYAGGDFTSVGGEIRRNVAALLPDGSLDTGFRADTDGEVNALVADGASLYIGGTYKNIGPYTQRQHRGLTKVDASSGAVDDGFKANIDASVYALAISGSRVYVGGNFSSVSNRGPAGSVNFPRLGGAAVNVATGAVEA